MKLYYSSINEKNKVFYTEYESKGHCRSTAMTVMLSLLLSYAY